jgi:uncharacterized integral membrane protein (TIGR00697 family)
VKSSSPKTNSKRDYRYFDLVMVLFVTVLITSNIASSAKIVDWGFSLGGIRMAFDAGTLLFPVSYIFGDVLVEVYGFKNSRRVIWAGFAMLVLSAVLFSAVQVMPGEANWQSSTGQKAYESILGGMSSGGIVAASLLAYLAGEFSNSIIMAVMKVATRGKWLWMRTIGSTIVGEGVDTVIFVLVASLAGVFQWQVFASLVITNYLFKVGVEVIFTPITYQAVRFLKKAEKEDYYDIGTRFSPI